VIVYRFSKYLNAIEYPKEKTSWNIAGILNDKNAFYKFDVRELTRTSATRAYQTGKTNTKADKMVFELDARWVIVDIQELHKYLKKYQKKDFELKELLSKLEWNISLPKR